MKKTMWTTIKKLCLVTCVSVGLLFFLSWALAIKQVAIYQGTTYHIQATIPYLSISDLLFCLYSKAFCKFSRKIFNHSRLSISHKDITSNLELYTGSFYSPLLFFYSEKHETVFVLYSADLYFAYLAVRIHEKTDEVFIGNYSKWWILSADASLSIEEMTRQELYSLIAALERMPEKEFRKLSVPTLDIGFYKHYMSQQDIIDILHEKLQGKRL